jgi:hypothetical protein
VSYSKRDWGDGAWSSQACSRGERRATGTDRGSVPKDPPTPANTGQHSHKGRIRGFARQKMPREVNGNQNDRHPPKFDELKDVM